MNSSEQTQAPGDIDSSVAGLVGRYEVRLASSTGNYHYDVWLEKDGKRVSYSDSGCSIAPHWFGWNKSACTREAKRATRRALRKYIRQQNTSPVIGTMTVEDAT